MTDIGIRGWLEKWHIRIDRSQSCITYTYIYVYTRSCIAEYDPLHEFCGLELFRPRIIVRGYPKSRKNIFSTRLEEKVRVDKGNRKGNTIICDDLSAISVLIKSLRIMFTYLIL